MALEFTLILVFQLVVAGVILPLAIIYSGMSLLPFQYDRAIFRLFQYDQRENMATSFMQHDTTITNY